MKNYSIDLAVMMLMTSCLASDNFCRAPIIWNKLAMNPIILAQATPHVTDAPGQVSSINSSESFSNPPVCPRICHGSYDLLLSGLFSRVLRKNNFLCVSSATVEIPLLSSPGQDAQVQNFPEERRGSSGKKKRGKITAPSFAGANRGATAGWHCRGGDS
jgi:hypothetical protein